MRSGTGRHRRPRQAPAIFVTAGVAGSAIALPLLAAGGAQAADTETWDRVAQCESGGLWSADTGNGYFGGLQLTQDTWEEYGGRDYAPRADLASRSQQISVAEKILAAKGPQAWPNCALDSGLTDDGEAPDVDPGIDLSRPAETLLPGESPAPGEDYGDSGSSASDPRDGGQEDREESGAPSGDHDQERGGSESPAPSEEAGSGKHRGAPADEDAGDGAAGSDRKAGESKGGGDGRENGRHASRGGDSGRAGKDGDYTVRPGDSLSAIAEEHSLAGGWPALYEANESVVGGDPDLILPGQKLDLGASRR
ncbi:transglycosylase family protein [Streptomyces sp. NPDC047108]|uniref:transglycosylase family protein n=1 Tax=Streptomyces sp. NPDC047108 TaxID=3155025 RepID=UPI003400FCC0